MLAQILSGTSDHRSAAYSGDLLGDLYGHDSVRVRVAHYRTDRQNTSGAPQVPPREVFGELFGTLPGNYLAGDAPPTTLFRFPMRFARWNFDGSIDQSNSNRTVRQIPEFAGVTPNTRVDRQPPLNGDDPRTTTTREPDDVYARQQYDDAYTGRITTFLEGPLAGKSFRVVRSFGQDDNPTYQQGTPESILAYNLVIDLAELPEREIEIGGQLYDLWVVADRTPGALLYGAGADDAPGRSNFDDDNNGTVDDLSELGFFGTDDIGHTVLINGQIFSGKGVNAGFASGAHNSVGATWTTYANNNNATGWIDPQMTAALQPNRRYIGQDFDAEDDEAYDAADLENMHLAWQPAIHVPNTVPIHGAIDADNLINQMIVPSYHRPALINYLMNQPIDFSGSSTPPRAFADLQPNVADDNVRLRILVMRLRRACLRPLPFAGGNEDLDGDDEFVDGTPDFTGSNITPILNVTLPYNPSKAQVASLANWLVNGPWDVDNDGDGIPDSVWLDFRLPTIAAADGTLLRPMVAPLIEDLDGRVNLNTAGNYAQLTDDLFGMTGFNGTTVATALEP
ncbi:MAG: hypothetical protein WBD31_22505, partial [Rubripirellula sp.]